MKVIFFPDNEVEELKLTEMIMIFQVNGNKSLKEEHERIWVIEQITPGGLRSGENRIREKAWEKT